MKRQQSQSRIKVPNKNKVWYLISIPIRLEIERWQLELVFRNIIVGSHLFSEIIFCEDADFSEIIWRKKSTVPEANVRESKSSWSKFSWIKKFLKQMFLTAHTNYYFSWSKCCNSFRDVRRSSTVAAQIRDLFGGGAPTIVLVDSKPVTHLCH